MGILTANSRRRHGTSKSRCGGDYSFVNRPGKWRWHTSITMVRFRSRKTAA